MSQFRDHLLDDPDTLERYDEALRPLAEAGALVRREWLESADALDRVIADGDGALRPRAVVAAGPDSRLLRAVLEPTCPVPFVAWPYPSLPGWAGALDLVVVLAPQGGDAGAASAVAEAIRRGCQVVVACPPRSMVAEHATGRDVVVLPVSSGDQLSTAVVTLAYLSRVGLGPRTEPESVAQALDDVAVACSPFVSQVENPAKLLAVALADGAPVIWGGSMLAARAARRMAESIRRASGRRAVAGDVDQLLPILERAQERDIFSDPFADDAGQELRPVLIVLDDGHEEPAVREARGRLAAAAAAKDLRVETIESRATSEIAQYAEIVATGRYTAAYLAVGLSPQ